MTPARTCLVNGDPIRWGADDVREYLGQYAAAVVRPYPFARHMAEQVETTDGVLSALPLPRGWSFTVRSARNVGSHTRDVAEAVRRYLRVRETA